MQALEVMLGIKMQKGPGGGDEDMPQAPQDTTAESAPQASAAAASSSGGGSSSTQQQQQQQANGTAKVGCFWGC